VLIGHLESFEPTKNLQTEPQTNAKWEDQDEKDDMVVKEKDSQSYPPDQDKMERGLKDNNIGGKGILGDNSKEEEISYSDATNG
jgi:hypothetical protein